MKIAIYETIHLDWVLPLCELFRDRADEVHFLTSAHFEDDIRKATGGDYSLFQWTYTEPQLPVLQFYREISRFFGEQSFDLIILNSVDARHLLLALALRNQRKARVYINLHDINNFLRPVSRNGFRSWIRTKGKKMLHQRADGFIVNALAMKNYIESQGLTSKKIFWLPPVIERAGNFQPAGEKIIITIPGSIDAKRRDYNTVLNTLEQLHQGFPGKIKLVLAGRPVGAYGVQILNRAKALARKGLDLEYSEKEVDELNFQNIIAGSTLIISPLVAITSIHDEITEVYGLTKCSGNIYDAIRHGKPLIVPSSLTVPEALSSSTLYYANEEELVTLLTQLLKDRDRLEDIGRKANANAKIFSKDMVAAKLEAILSNAAR